MTTMLQEENTFVGSKSHTLIDGCRRLGGCQNTQNERGRKNPAQANPTSWEAYKTHKSDGWWISDSLNASGPTKRDWTVFYSPTAMGTSFVPQYTNLFMHKLGTEFFKKQKLQPNLYTRYIYDIFFCLEAWRREPKADASGFQQCSPHGHCHYCILQQIP